MAGGAANNGAWSEISRNDAREPDKLFAEFKANPPVSRDSVARCQSNLSFPLPADYVQFLEQMNGGEGFVGKKLSDGMADRGFDSVQ